MTDIIRLAMKARADAVLVVDRHTNPSQKAASLALYNVMGTCMELCERCTDPEEKQRLHALFLEQPKTGNRRFVEKGSDIFVLVCRYVFTETDRTNAMRYASALREASKLNLSSADLPEHMKKNGGVNALYFRRPLNACRVKTKCLRLSTTIDFSRDKPFMMILRWRDDNTFEVIEQKEMP